MTQEEIQEYNKRCALFLGGIYSNHAEAWGFGNAEVIKTPINFDKKIYHGVIEAERFEKDLKFHSDWNWIMEVVEKIQLLDIVHDNTRSYDSVFKTYECTFSPSYKTHDFGYIRGTSKTSEKEAVVQAINQFLLWYKNPR